MYKSKVIDSDEAKKLLPEYNDGWGAGVVHKESQRISEQQLITALDKGENITYILKRNTFSMSQAKVSNARRKPPKKWVGEDL